MAYEEDGPRERTAAERAALPSVRFGLKSSISVAWLTFEANRRQMMTFRDAWEPLVSEADWRSYVREHLIPAQPFLYLAVRDDLDRRKLRKTKTGVSAHVPFAELEGADERDELLDYCMELIRDIYVKWAATAGAPPPPDLPVGAAGAETA